MVESISKANQNKITEFVKDETIFFAVGNQFYDKVVKFEKNPEGKHEVTGAFADLEQAAEDCENFFRYLKMYDGTFRRFEPKEELPEAKDMRDAQGKFYNCIILKNYNMEYIVRVLRLVRDHIKELAE